MAQKNAFCLGGQKTFLLWCGRRVSEAETARCAVCADAPEQGKEREARGCASHLSRLCLRAVGEPVWKVTKERMYPGTGQQAKTPRWGVFAKRWSPKQGVQGTRLCRVPRTTMRRRVGVERRLPRNSKKGALQDGQTPEFCRWQNSVQVPRRTHQHKRAPRMGCPFVLVRETGLEPVWKIHTPLKRARLPVPPLPRDE